VNFLAWCLSLTILVVLSFEGTTFYKATVCRQKAWLKGTELQTRTLLHNPTSFAFAIDVSCRLRVVRKNKTITWQRLPQMRKHSFELSLRGKI